MPSPWDTIIAFDAAIVTSSALMPGVEDVVYITGDGSEIPMSAQVFRGDNPGNDIGVSLGIVVVISRALVPIVHKGSDRVRLAKKLGEDPVPCTVAAVLSQDVGGFTLQLE